MSRRSTPRRQAARRVKADRAAQREASQTLHDIMRAGRALPDLAERNQAETRARVDARYAAIRAERAIPATFTGGPKPAPKPMAPKPAPVVVKPVPVAPKVYAPILAKDVPADSRELCKVHKAAGELSAAWFPIGAMPKGDDRTVYARLHGASVRYAVAA